jgi:hypothetical protein
MRPDQRKRLQDLEERLADAFLEEADPDGWSEDKKERYWQRREAAETGALMARVQALLDKEPDHDKKDPDDQKETDRMIRAAAARAQAAVERAIARAKKAA